MKAVQMEEWVRGVGRNRADQFGEVAAEVELDGEGQGGGKMAARPEEREG